MYRKCVSSGVRKMCVIFMGEFIFSWFVGLVFVCLFIFIVVCVVCVMVL